VRKLTVVFLAGFLSCTDSTAPGGSGLPNATTLATDFERSDRAVATPQLRSLSGLATPIANAGVDVHNMGPTSLGRTVEWSAIHREVIFTSRAGAPADAVRLILYTTDSTSRPAYPLIEIGYADLYPHNTFTGGGPDSMSLRFVVTATPNAVGAVPPLRGAERGSGGEVVADFIAHSHADSTCQCATVEGWVSDGTTRVDFRSVYNIPLGLDGQFPGTFSSPAIGFQHFATLPGPGVSTATANLALSFGSDSITMTSGLLRPHAGQLNGSSALAINGAHYALVTRSATGTTAAGPSGQRLSGAQLRAAGALFAVPADLAYYIEWPTFVIFFCGC